MFIFPEAEPDPWVGFVIHFFERIYEVALQILGLHRTEFWEFWEFWESLIGGGSPVHSGRYRVVHVIVSWNSIDHLWKGPAWLTGD